MKKVVMLVLILSCLSFAQVEDVATTHKIYGFLERLSVLKVISQYNSFETPVSRKQVARYLNEASQHTDLLDLNDKQMLDDLKHEFGFELTGDLATSQSMFGPGGYNLLSQEPKYFYFYNKPETGSFFMNLLVEGGIAGLKKTGNTNNSELGLFGGEVRGSLMNKFGFFLRGTNGNVFGNKDAALHIHRLSYNWNLTQDNSTGSFFDETNGYITVDYDAVKLKLGRDRQLIGYGVNKLVLGDNAPETDFLSLHLKLGIMEYSFFHGKILGDKGIIGDSIRGALNTVGEKYLGYHRISFALSNSFSIGAGEMVIYANRPLDLSYLNPFALYKAVEHSGQDRDNSMLFFDASSSAIKGIKLWGVFFIDDISYGKVGTGWFGNQTVCNLGVESYSFYSELPLELSFEYFRIEPYVFTHRFHSNNYTNDGYNLGLDSDPNSKIFFFQANYRLNHRTSFNMHYTYRVHGANPTDPETGTVTNVGGDINLGHRSFDAENITFMDGTIEYFRKASIALIYEPFLGHYVSFLAENETNSLQNNVIEKNWFFYLSVSLRM